ncbi:MAG: monovalent cation/H+ antiporter complex subunit F [Planctomycetota bacterium]
MYGATALLLLIAMGLAMLRALRGPTVFDRILAVNMFGTATVLMISVVGFMSTAPDLVDIALIYALISFTGTIAVLRFVEINLARRTVEPVEGDA